MEIETKTEELQNTNVEETTSTVETTTTENVVEEPKPIKYFLSHLKKKKIGQHITLQSLIKQILNY